jgi:FixJ family two-component response regulator
MNGNEARQNQKPVTVAIIEDDIQVRNTITDILEKTGYNVMAFDDADLAYKTITLKNIDCDHVHAVLLDAVLNRHRAPAEKFLVKMTQADPKTRIIVMSGVLSPMEFFDYIFKGASDFFSKPISKNGLLEKVRKHVFISQYKCQFSSDPWESINRTNRKIFLSYATADVLRASGLARLLENYDLHVWYADRSMPAGSEWRKTLDSAHDECPVFLCLLSSAALKSKWVGAEIQKALYRKKSEGNNYHFIPLFINIKLDELPEDLRNFHCVNFSDGDHLVDSFQTLRLSIETFLDAINL